MVYTGGNFTTSILNQDTVFWLCDISCGVRSASGKIKITSIPSPTLNITASTNTLCFGETVTLTASGAATYTWLTFNSNQAVAVLTATNSTTHGVNGTSVNGCIGSKTFNLIVNACLGIDSQKKSSESLFQIYPNPSTGNITLIGNNTTLIKVFNELGELINTSELSEANQFKNEIHDLPNGIYFFQSSSKSVTSTNKVIILK